MKIICVIPARYASVQAQRIIRLEDGHVVYDGPSDAPEAVVTPRIAGTEEGRSA